MSAVASQDSAPVAATTSKNVDAFGTEIKPGQTIAYAVRQGSNLWLNKLVVELVSDKGIRGYDPTVVNQRRKTLTNRSTIVVLNQGTAN